MIKKNIVLVFILTLAALIFTACSAVLKLKR